MKSWNMGDCNLRRFWRQPLWFLCQFFRFCWAWILLRLDRRAWWNCLLKWCRWTCRNLCQQQKFQVLAVHRHFQPSWKGSDYRLFQGWRIQCFRPSFRSTWCLGRSRRKWHKYLDCSWWFDWMRLFQGIRCRWRKWLKWRSGSWSCSRKSREGRWGFSLWSVWISFGT